MYLESIRYNLKKVTYSSKYPDVCTESGFKKYFLNPSLAYKVSILQFLEMIKNFFDTFRPYKTLSHLIPELKFFITGLVSSLSALLLSFASIISSPLYILSKLVSGNVIEAFLILPNSVFTLLTAQLLAFSILIRSLSEMIASPLIILRIPLRSLITWWQGWPKFETNSGLVRALDHAEANLNLSLTPERLGDYKYIIEHLNKKAIKAKFLNQSSDLENFNNLPHIDEQINASLNNFNNARPSYELPEQTNRTYVNALESLTLAATKDLDPRPALREYFQLFKMKKNDDPHLQTEIEILGSFTVP